MRKISSGPFTRHNMMTPMLLAVPRFQPDWELCIEGWQGEGEQDTPNYMGLSMLADLLIGALEVDDRTTLRAAFSVVERWFVEGDNYVQNAAAVGLFEDMYEADRYTTATPELMLPWMSPLCRTWWESING